MFKANKFTILGIILAFCSFAVLSGDNFISAAIASLQLAGLPRELRLGIESGFIEPGQCSKKALNTPCSALEFGEKLQLLFEQVGIIELADAKELAKSGIFTAKPGKNRINRRETFEILARACIFLAEKGLIKLPASKPKNFRDYKVPQKYIEAAAYMQNRYIARGYPDGSLGVGRNISHKEAVFFIYRLYEAVAADMMSARTESGIRFVDINLSHPVMDSINTLTNAGAFDKLMLKPAFDGEAHLKTAEMSEMLEGIFAKAGKSIDMIRVKSVLPPASEMVSRKQLALTLEYILDAMENTISPDSQTPVYSDVSSEAPEFTSLRKLAAAGIMLGYHNRLFKGTENVTWFESVTAIAKTIKNAENQSPGSAKSHPERLAQKQDIEALMALIQAKKARVRQILDTKKPYRR